MKKEVVAINLRIPKELWEKVKAEAEENNRSLNSEIIYRVKKGGDK